MNRFFTLFILLSTSLVKAQVLSVNNMVTAVSLTSSKADNFISQKGFSLVSSNKLLDTVFQAYQYKKKKQKDYDSIQRSFSKFASAITSGAMYETNSSREFVEMKDQLKRAGFVCAEETDTTTTTWFFQKENLTAHASIQEDNGDTLYSVKVQRINLPGIKDIMYGEDLLAFTSHENLVYTFGKNNVKKDIYFFSEKEFNRCSVLFPNTPRQAVFLWDDQTNDCHLQYIIFGGQLMVQGAMNYDQIVGENNWMLKSKIHAGLSLTELRRFHGTDFTFYSGKSPYSGMVIPSAPGGINFKQEGVVLACLNCNDNKFMSLTTMTADEAIQEGRRFFILTIMLYPGSLPKAE
ncbi:MAG TPA: hypothetical protein VF487_05560 [Chitinophagaceae bacterium]